LRALLREVSHRSRNLLAIIQSIATQTGRYSPTIEQFLRRFRGRLQSLASSQDLITSSNWRGAGLGELVISQVGRYTQSPHRAIHFDGERPWLNPNTALHVGLALHELAVNSVSFGALSKPDGFVTISGRLEPGPPGTTSLALTWSETIGGPDDQAPDEATREKRFGSVALERIVPASLNGSASLEIAGGKLEYRLVIPFGNFEAD
jgi:two-component sensor histidine kinase